MSDEIKTPIDAIMGFTTHKRFRDPFLDGWKEGMSERQSKVANGWVKYSDPIGEMNDAHHHWNDGFELAVNVKALIKELATAKAEVESTRQAYTSNKECLRRHFDLLQTLLEQFDQYADGSPDATSLGKFCNEMIGIYNGLVSLKDTQSLAQERDQLKKELAEAKKDAERLDWLETSRSNITAPWRGLEYNLRQAIDAAIKQKGGE